MSRHLVWLSVAVLVLSTLVIASTIARPDGDARTVEQVNMTRPDFERVFRDVASLSVPAFDDVQREALRQSALKRIVGAGLNR